MTTDNKQKIDYGAATKSGRIAFLSNDLDIVRKWTIERNEQRANTGWEPLQIIKISTTTTIEVIE